MGLKNISAQQSQKIWKNTLKGRSGRSGHQHGRRGRKSHSRNWGFQKTKLFCCFSQKTLGSLLPVKNWWLEATWGKEEKTFQNSGFNFSLSWTHRFFDELRAQLNTLKSHDYLREIVLKQSFTTVFDSTSSSNCWHRGHGELRFLYPCSVDLAKCLVGWNKKHWEKSKLCFL